MARKTEKEITELAEKVAADSVSLEKKKVNANYILHTMRLGKLPKIDITDAEQVADRSAQYLEICVSDGIRPNVAGYALALGTSVDDLNNAFTDRRMNREAAGEITRGLAQIEDIMIGMMLDSRIMPVTAIFLLKNHLGYHDQTELRVRSERIETADPAALESKYESVMAIEDEELPVS